MNRLNEATLLACKVINVSSSAAWSLFLIPLWRAILAQNSHVLADKLISTLRLVTLEDVSTRRLPSEIWEDLLDECTILMNSDFGEYVLRGLGEVKISSKHSHSPMAMEYFVTFRHAAFAQIISEKKEFSSDISDENFLILKTMKVQSPFLQLKASLNEEEIPWISGLQMRENDHVLLRPWDTSYSEALSWEHSFLGVITMIGKDFSDFQLNVRLASGEGLSRITSFEGLSIRIYFLSSSVTYYRMTQALRSLTMCPNFSLRPVSSYIFSPEMQFLLLCAYDAHAGAVAE
ncbi:AAA family protein, partial [Cardiosporidium cionae]